MDAASTTMARSEEVSSGMNSMVAPSRRRSEPAEATVTWFSSAVATSALLMLSPWRLNQAV